jgi:5-methylcytosine-specific restriction endonuclease McrA
MALSRGRPKIKWTSKMVALLGRVYDTEVARRYGISQPSVTIYRNKLGIPPFTPFGGVNWTPEMDSLLGTTQDKKVAALLGLCMRTARLRRIELGISTWRKQQSRQKGPWRKRVAELPDTLTVEQWEFACEWFDDRCAYCGQEAFLVQEHLIPVSKGGPRIALNIVPACYSCNNSKRSKRAHLWIYEHFGRVEGRKIAEHLVEYLTEVKGRSR